MKDLEKFSIKYVARKMNSINIQINLKHQNPFPKDKERFLSYYTYSFRFVQIEPNGYFNRARFVSSMIDFSFIKSLVADKYSNEGGHCYDPCSIFMLDLFKWLEEYDSMADFCRCLHDKYNGHAYRTYAGIKDEHIPCEADFSNFRKKIGEEKYDAIFHILVEIVRVLGLITGRILSHDGTLVPTFACYRGCNYASGEKCSLIQVKGDFLVKTRKKILKLIEDPANLKFEKELRTFTKCPRKDELPKGVKPPSIHIADFKIVPFDRERFNPYDQTAKLLGVAEELKRANLMLVPVRSNIAKIDLNLKDNPVFVRCPRIPYDLDARTGYKRSNTNPNKKVPVFGYMVTITTSVEPETGLELPIATMAGPGSDKDGHHFIPLREKIKKFHPNMKTYLDIGDCGFDFTENYEYARNNGSLPFFDYNPRGEKLSQDVLYRRGYDKNGIPYAPCKCLCRPNGYDKEAKEVVFVCKKQCLKDKLFCPQLIPECPHLSKRFGYTKHISIPSNSRLFTEIPRGTLRWKKIRNMRSSSERTNSTAKTDLDILRSPQVMSLERMKILDKINALVTLLKRVISFIVKVTLTLRKARQTDEMRYWRKLQFRRVTPSVYNLITQRE